MQYPPSEDAHTKRYESKRTKDRLQISHTQRHIVKPRVFV